MDGQGEELHADAATGEATAAADGADDEQEHDGAEERDEEAGQVEAGEADLSRQQRREQEAAEERADDADEHVADEAEAGAFHDEAGEPAGDATYDDPDEQRLQHDGPSRCMMA